MCGCRGGMCVALRNILNLCAETATKRIEFIHMLECGGGGGH